MDTAIPTFDEVTAILDAHQSNWVRDAIMENTQRDLLFATEDLVMLADIFVAFSKKTLSPNQVLGSPLTGKWLKSAIQYNLSRDFNDVIDDTQTVRDVFVRALCLSYADGRFSDNNTNYRAMFILDRFTNIQQEITLSWWRAAAERLNDCADSDDAGVAQILEMAKGEDFCGNIEIAEQLVQLSHLSPGELRRQLLLMASYLYGSQSRLN